jgi:hypothetical protein
VGAVQHENISTVSLKGFRALLWNALLVLRRLRTLKLDAAVDLGFFSRGSAALTFLAGARRRVGFHAFFGGGPYRGNLLTHRLPYNPHLHAGHTFLTLVEAALRDPATLPALDPLPPPQEGEPRQASPAADEVTEVKELLRREAGGCPRLILLNPNAGDLLPSRRWPDERYVKLARRLLAKYPEVFVVMTGAPGERAATDELVCQVGSRRCISLAGKTTLRQLLVLYTLAGAGDQRQRPRPFCGADSNSRNRVVRTGNAGVVHSAHAAQHGSVGGHRLQLVRERIQQSPVPMPQQPVHASDHCGSRVRRNVPCLRAKGSIAGCQNRLRVGASALPERQRLNPGAGGAG